MQKKSYCYFYCHKINYIFFILDWNINRYLNQLRFIAVRTLKIYDNPNTA